MSVQLKPWTRNIERRVKISYLETMLKLRRALLAEDLLVECLLAMGLPLGLPFMPFNLDESIGRPFNSAAMANNGMGKRSVFVD